jgi:hypothetical protein
MMGNVLHKGAKANNTRVIAYGFEGIKHEKNALFVVSNTMVYENHRGGAFFVDVKNRPRSFVAMIRNNVCAGKIPLTNLDQPNVNDPGNVLVKTLEEAKFVDAAKFDFRLKAESPAIDKGAAAGKAENFDLSPKFEYMHPAKSAERKAAGALDAGAFEFSK